MGRLFGTDGVRGTYGESLTDSLARALGRAAAIVLGLGHPRPRFLIGRDTRSSCEPLEHALVAGIADAGGEALLTGVIPTPAVAHLVGAYGVEAGAVISASHNPARDNGIKFFGPDGMKLPDAVEGAIEALVEGSPTGDTTGVPALMGDAEERYLEFLLAGAQPLAGLRVAVDCANGAAFRVAPEAYRRAGAEVTAIAVAPDGENINHACGSTHPEELQRLVVSQGADVGIAHDGDADRMIAVDEHGMIVDGDQILAVCALDALERGALPGRSVVATVMANLGFRKAMARERIEVVETAVGDRYVLEAMRERAIALGGEQSGHIIFLDHHTTGDGVMTALRLLGVVASSGKRLSELAAVCPRMPQALVAVRVRDRSKLEGAGAVWAEVGRVKEELGEEGRVVVRPSGTEPVVRVMVEAASDEAAHAAADRIAAVVTRALG